MKKIYLFSDGAARGNPGPAGAGFLLLDDNGAVVCEGKKYLGEATNNQAEYAALKEGLAEADRMGYKVIEISLDSELVVRQIKGEYRIKNAGLKPLYKDVIELLKKFEVYNIRHVPREQNSHADRLANFAIDEAL